MVLRPAEIAVIILTFSEYLIRPFHSMLNLETMSEQDKHRIVIIVSFLALGDKFSTNILLLFNYWILLYSLAGLITYINLVSVKLYVKINNIFGFCKVFACLIVIFVGIYEICIGNTGNLKGNVFEGTNLKFGPMALAFYNGLWSYDGWSSVTTITEEIKKPEKLVSLFIIQSKTITKKFKA